jgi:hypothetical protein
MPRTGKRYKPGLYMNDMSAERLVVRMSAKCAGLTGRPAAAKQRRTPTFCGARVLTAASGLAGWDACGSPDSCSQTVPTQPLFPVPERARGLRKAPWHATAPAGLTRRGGL